MIRLTLPYPCSANRYWRTAVVAGRVSTFVSGEAKQYRRDVELAWMQAYGARAAATGPLTLTLALHGPCPQDWAKRERKEGPNWWLDARCIDLGNAEKVVADALQGLAYADDKQLVEQHKFKRPPDERGARVEIWIEPWGGE
ncbi:MAG: RusA family crossover junction endodeoxyribonuclease [Xanthomonadaceae bacterium]|nr:RusA family crossover junction endodeoxyribonuclease [Xanthomonadaceae bacterium]